MKESRESLANQIGGWLCMLIYPVIMGFAVAVTIYVDGMCFKSLLMLVAWLVSLCFLWSLPSILQRIGRKKEILRDERDTLIVKNAALAAHAVSWLYFLSACLIVWRLVGTNGSVSVNILPLIFVGGIAIYQISLVFSSLILEGFGRLNGQ